MRGRGITRTIDDRWLMAEMTNVMSDTGKLAGRKALVTGAGRGIGRAIALAFAEEGADVALIARGRAELEEVAAEIEKLNGRTYPIACDITDKVQIMEAVKEAEARLGQIDTLVNSAGIGLTHKFIGHDDEIWERTLAVNLTGVYLVTKEVVPGMVRRKWGRIMNMASFAGRIGAKYMAAYTASKHGVIGLTRALAMEFVNDGITVNAICPAYVETPMVEAAIANMVQKTGRTESDARRALEELNPQKRLIQPEEVAAVAVFLATEEAKGITGQAINIDGGAVMS